MSQFTIHLDLEPYLAQWFIHEQGGEHPVSLTRGSAESDILELFLTVQPEAIPTRPAPTDTAIYIPTFKHKDVRDRFKGKWDSEEEFAEQLLDDCYPDIPEFARRYFDIGQFARDLFNFDYTFIDGYVFSDY